MADLQTIPLPTEVQQAPGMVETLQQGFNLTQLPGGATSFYKPPEVAKLATDMLGATNTSAPAQNQVDQLGGQIQKAIDQAPPIETGPDLTALKSFQQQQTDLLTGRQAQLSERRKAETERINAEFQRLQEQQALQQKKEVGVTSTKLARMGGYLGLGSSAETFMLDLDRSHRAEVQSLEQKRQQTLAMAQQAYEDKDFALAQKQLNLARQSEQDIYQRTQEYNQAKSQLGKEELANKQLEQKTMQSNVKFALDYNISEPYYSVDGKNVIDTKTGEFIDINTLPETTNIQIIKKPLEPKDFAIAQFSDGQFLVNKLTGERQYIGPLEAKMDTIDVDNRVKLINLNTGEIVADLGAKSYKGTSGGGGGSAKTEKAINELNIDMTSKINELKRKGLNREEIWEEMLNEFEADIAKLFPDQDPGDIIHAAIYAEEGGLLE